MTLREGRKLKFADHEVRSSGCSAARMNNRCGLLIYRRSFEDHPSLSAGIMEASSDRNWYAVFTVPQNEKSALKHLDVHGIESFLPTYESVRDWKNRQRVKITLPLFPTYLFVHINSSERSKVLQSPGVLRILGSGRDHASIPDSEVEFLRSGCCGHRMEPYRELVIGEKARIISGPFEGVQGILVKKNNSLRFVLTIELINQHAAIEVSAENLVPEFG